MGNSASSLPYSIGKQVSLLENGWSLHEGQQKSDGRTVSVFVAKKPSLTKTPIAPKAGPGLTQLRPALHHFAYSRRLRHPQILTVHATLDTDNPSESGAAGAEYKGTAPSTANTGDLIIVTEACIPLDQWLKQERPDPELVAWGLESTCRALHFLHASANLSHGNVCPASLFVTRAGDVKLFNFVLASNVAAASGGLDKDFLDYEKYITPAAYRSPERVENQWETLTTAGGTHAMDSYAMGVLISHFYNGHIPGPLVKATQRLQTQSVKMRPRLQPLLKCPVFDTPYQKIQLQLEEFAVQPVEAKIGFWNNLTPSMKAGLYPAAMCHYKIFPIIVSSLQTICSSESIRTQDMYRREVLAMLVPLFYIAETHLGDDFSNEMGPLVTLLFTINDRGVRGSLLKKTSVLVKYLDNNSLNVNVFEPMCSGLSDSSAALRELTLKATSILVPHLTQPNLEKLSRYLVRMQSDTEDSIRTHTVTYFGKLAPYLTEVSRSKLLMPALIRGMKDVMSTTRLAALQATLSVKQFFSPAGIASQVVPAVAPCLVDPSATVRKEAFSIMEDLLFVLRQESERLSHLPEPQGSGGGHAAVANSVPLPPVSASAPAVVAAPFAAPAPAASSGSYFSSWMTSSSSSTPVPAPASVAPVATAPVTAPVMPRAAPPIVDATLIDDAWGDDDDIGWGDDDNDLAMRNLASAPRGSSIGGASSKLRVPGAKLSKASPVVAVKPAVQKLSLEDSIDDGWDDF